MVEIKPIEEEKKRSFYSILAPRVVKIEMTLKENAEVGSKKAPAKLKIYSINGQKVAEVGSMADAEYILAPGVYVCGGKKYVIK